MRMRFGVLLVAACSLFIVGRGSDPLLAQVSPPTGGTDKRTPAPQPRTRTVPQRQWEYKAGSHCDYPGDVQTTVGPFETELSDLGKEGWELVAITPVALREGDRRQCFMTTFKRAMLF